MSHSKITPQNTSDFALKTGIVGNAERNQSWQHVSEGYRFGEKPESAVSMDEWEERMSWKDMDRRIHVGYSHHPLGATRSTLRGLYTVVTLNGGIVAWMTMMSNNMWVSVALIITTAVSGFLEEHTKRWIITKDDSTERVERAIQYVVIIVFGCTVIMLLLYEIPRMVKKCKGKLRRRNRELFEFLIKKDLAKDSLADTHTNGYNSEDDPIGSYLFFHDEEREMERQKHPKKGSRGWLHLRWSAEARAPLLDALEKGGEYDPYVFLRKEFEERIRKMVKSENVEFAEVDHRDPKEGKGPDTNNLKKNDPKRAFEKEVRKHMKQMERVCDEHLKRESIRFKTWDDLEQRWWLTKRTLMLPEISYLQLEVYVHDELRHQKRWCKCCCRRKSEPVGGRWSYSYPGNVAGTL